MLNRATNTLQTEEEAGGLLGVSWQVDQHPLIRLLLLFGMIVCPLAVIGWRVSQLQFGMAPTYAAEFSKLRETTEEIHCRPGRILTSDGLAAADDVPGLQVQVHYRWIEEPPDARWLSQKVQARLSRAERRKPERVQQEMGKVLEERTALWMQLGAVTGLSADEVALRRKSIQARIERMKARVAARRAEEASKPVPPPAPPKDWQESIQNWFVTWVLDTPEYRPPEEIVLQEELAYYSLVEFPQIDAQVLQVRGKLRSHPEQYPNLRIVDVTHREYPLGAVAAHVIGYRKPLTQEELKARQARLPEGDPMNYRLGDRVGQTGLEVYYERHLRCIPGERKLWMNSQGEIVKEVELRAPRPGKDLELTLNIPLQRKSEAMLAAVIDAQPVPASHSDEAELPVLSVKPPQSGCIGVMDVRTGEMLVAAAWPTFDIDLYLNGTTEQRRQIEADHRFPLYPRLHKMTLAPGSVFKALTATAMLQAGYDGQASFYCQGYLDTPTKRRCMPFVHSGVGHADVNLAVALAKSCNVYFFHGAREIGGRKLLESAAHFGFGHPTGIDLPNESSGNLPVMPCDHLGVAIGQASLTVTPIQILRMMAAIANGGELLTPRVARRSGAVVVGQSEDAGSEDSLLATPQPQSIPNLSSYMLEQVRHGLEQVVAMPGGTGYKTVRLKEIRIAGKTGTAEARGGQDHAWFSGYVPAEQPRYAFVIVLERGGAGGKVAGPLAKQLVQAMLEEGLINQAQQLTQAE